MTLNNLEAQSQMLGFNGIVHHRQIKVQLAELSHEEHQVDYNLSFNEPKQKRQLSRNKQLCQLYLIPKSAKGI